MLVSYSAPACLHIVWSQRGFLQQHPLQCQVMQSGRHPKAFQNETGCKNNVGRFRLTYGHKPACWCTEERIGAALCGHWLIPGRTASSRTLETVLGTMSKRNLRLRQAVPMSRQVHIIASLYLLHSYTPCKVYSDLQIWLCCRLFASMHILGSMQGKAAKRPSFWDCWTSLYFYSFAPNRRGLKSWL